MIFRRSNDPAPIQRKTPQTTATEQRREPVVTPRALNNNTLSQTGPVSPHTVAQQRRTTTSATPASSFSGKDQSRKLTVGRDISLNGEIGACDHLVVEGTVRATVKGGKMLEISETGTFTGMVDIDNADIAGRFEGDLIVRGKLTIRPTAHVTGHLHYDRLQVDTGATINAQLNALEPIAQQEYTSEHDAAPVTPVGSQEEAPRLFSLASINDEPGFLRANAN